MLKALGISINICKCSKKCCLLLYLKIISDSCKILSPSYDIIVSNHFILIVRKNHPMMFGFYNSLLSMLSNSQEELTAT